MRFKSSAQLRDLPNGRLVRACGIVTLRQQPETAKGVIFVSLEDEDGAVQVIVWKGIREQQRKELMNARLLGVYELSSPHKWEFLYWIVPSGADEASRRAYVRYAQHWLPNFPPEVLLEWIGRHGRDGMTCWSHLPLEQLRFEEVAWTYEDLAKIQAIDPHWTEVGPDTGGHQNLHRPRDWPGQYILANGTWNAPIIVIDHPTAVKVGGSVVPAGLVLIEGHNRISRMLNVPSKFKDDRRHRVMLGRVV